MGKEDKLTEIRDFCSAAHPRPEQPNPPHLSCWRPKWQGGEGRWDGEQGKETGMRWVCEVSYSPKSHSWGSTVGAALCMGLWSDGGGAREVPPF